MTGDSSSRQYSDVRTRRIAPTELYHEEYDNAVYGVEQTIVTGRGHDAETTYEPVVIDRTALEALQREHGRRDGSDDPDDLPLWLNGTVLAHYADDNTLSQLTVARGDDVVESLRPDSTDADDWTAHDAAVSVFPDPFQHFEDAQGKARDSLLTPREAEVWYLKKGVGLTRRDTAHVLGIGDNTAKTHLRNAREKKEQTKNTRRFFKTVGGELDGGE